MALNLSFPTVMLTIYYYLIFLIYNLLFQYLDDIKSLLFSMSHVSTTADCPPNISPTAPITWGRAVLAMGMRNLFNVDRNPLPLCLPPTRVYSEGRPPWKGSILVAAMSHFRLFRRRLRIGGFLYCATRVRLLLLGLCRAAKSALVVLSLFLCFRRRGGIM